MENNLKPGYGFRIKALRTQLNYSVKDFADACNVSGAQIYNIEREETIPTGKFLRSLIHLFNVNNNWIMFGYGEMGDIKTNLKQESSQELENIIKEISKKLDDSLSMQKMYLKIIENLSEGHRSKQLGNRYSGEIKKLVSLSVAHAA